MKYFVLVALFFQIFSINLRSQKKLGFDINWVTPEYIDPVYYSCSPIYYSYYTSPVYYYYHSYPSYSTPTTYFYYRKNQGNSKEDIQEKKSLKDKSVEELQAELANIKKEIWGDEKFDTKELRNSGKVYDPRWLLAQMKITRVAELEDFLKLKQEAKGDQGKIQQRKQVTSTLEQPKNISALKRFAPGQQPGQQPKKIIPGKRMNPMQEISYSDATKQNPQSMSQATQASETSLQQMDPIQDLSHSDVMIQAQNMTQQPSQNTLQRMAPIQDLSYSDVMNQAQNMIQQTSQSQKVAPPAQLPSRIDGNTQLQNKTQVEN